MPYFNSDLLLEALKKSGRSAREVSLAAVGHESAIRSIKRGLDLRVSTAEALCRELDLEFYIGPPRPPAPPENLNNPPVHSDNPIDKALLKTAIETCERGLDEIDRELEAGKKAEMVLAIYDLLGDNESSTDNKNNIVKLITRNVA